MNHPRQLLLITQPEPVSSGALLYALKLTEDLDARLRIVSFVHSEAVDMLGLMNHERRDKARKSLMDVHRLWLQSETSGLRHKGYEVLHEVVWEKRTAQGLSDYIAHDMPDLVIKDLHEESAFKRMVLSSLDWDLLNASPISILFVKDVPERLPLKVIAALDFGWAGTADAVVRDRIVSTANSLALACSGALHLISVYDRTEHEGGLVKDAADKGDVPSFEARKTLFDRFCQTHGIAQEHRHFLAGAPASSIHGYIERNGYALLVMTATQTFASRWMGGDTAERVLGHPACSVLMLKSDFITGRERLPIADVSRALGSISL